MKILALFHDNIGDVRGLSRRINLEFLLRLNDLYDLKIYGPNTHLYNDKTLVPLLYNKSHNMKFIVNEIKPHIVMCFTNALTTRWLPVDFKYLTTPKVIIECDYYSVKDKTWYRNNNFDLVIHRGSEFDENIPSVWLPFAANEDFYTDINDINHRGRKKLVSFFGSYIYNVYKNVRKAAIDLLEDNNLLYGRNTDEDLKECYDSKEYISIEDKRKWKETKENYRYIVSNYPKKLKECVCSLSCAGGDLKQTVGKIYEIMASGTVLLTQMFLHYDILFDSDCCVFYKDDCSDIIEKAKKIINDVDYSEYIAKNGVKNINKHHLVEHRINEFCNVLESLYYGKEIPRKWKK